MYLVHRFSAFVLPLIAVALLNPSVLAQHRPNADTTYGAIFNVKHDVMEIPLGIQRLDFDLSSDESLDFSDADAVDACVRTVTVYDGSFEGLEIAADALPDTARPLLRVLSSDLARALTASQPRYISRLFFPPFDATRRQRQRETDRSLTFLVGFRNVVDRAAFMSAAVKIEGVLYVEPDRRASAAKDL